MTKEEILAGESKNLEFKRSRPERSIQYTKSVVAFANSKGGKIVFGVDDQTRDIIGIPEENVFQEIDAITNAISDSCKPLIIPDIYAKTIDGKTVIIVEINEGKQKPYYIKQGGITDGVYIRISGTTRKADETLTNEIYYESQGRSYDKVIRRDLSISEQEIEKLCIDLKKVALSNCKDDTQREKVKDVTKNILLNWGILAEDENGEIHPTNAYVLLTGQDPFLSKIQCGLFKGTTRTYFLDKRDYEGPLWEQIEGAFEFVLRNIHLGAKIEGLYRKDIYELPTDSIRELIMNAVMNCSFIQSSHIQVAIFDNRLEITSPGGLMPGVTIERMKEGYSQIRNRALAHAFLYMNLIEGWGTGIPKLFREMDELGLTEPEIIDKEIALRINLYRKDKTLPNNTQSVPADDLKTPCDMQKINENRKDTGGISPLNRKLNNQEIKILDLIRKNGSITSSLIAESINLNRRSVQRLLLKMIKDGLISKEGSGRNTHYILNPTHVGDNTQDIF